MNHVPSYIELYEQGILHNLAEKLDGMLHSCELCPRKCGIDRHSSKDGYCRSGADPVVSSAQPHFGEEPPLVGSRGSGTIFFTHCNLGCVFCQNYDISHLGYGKTISALDLAALMLLLQKRGCHNINMVTPTHMIYPIVKALNYAVPRGLSLPLVYNSGGYDSVETLEMIEDVFDIYMPDFKYFRNLSGEEYSDADDYADVARAAVREMYRQVGDLKTDQRGVAYRGLIVRHLVLPGAIEETFGVIDFIADLSPRIYLNLMDQYRPEYHAREYPLLRRRVTMDEFDRSEAHARERGISCVSSILKKYPS